ncbi:MAG: hypothetical protein ACM3NQ_21770 [Bacteroidales bacterium]
MRRHRPCSAVSVLVMLAFLPALGGQALDVRGHIDRAIRLLLSPDSRDEQCKDGLVSLLDAITGAASYARIEGTWPATVAAARDQASRDELGGAVGLLNDSYRAVYGAPFQKPATVRSVQDAKDHIRGLLSSARSVLNQGRADEAVRLMLEAAVMIVTPLER